MYIKKINIVILFTLLLSTLSSCGGYKKVDARKVPTNAQERARQNVNEGKGVSVGNILGNRNSNTNYEFSTSNPLWRASLEILDFLPLAVVDYSGGLVITDWYADNSNPSESLKITVRFLSNEVRSDSLKITVHRKKCTNNSNCTVNLVSSKIQEELGTSIIRKAAVLEKKSSNKK